MRMRLAPTSPTLEFLTWALARHCSVCFYNGKLLITPCYAKYACEPRCGGCLGKSCLTPTNSVERSCECRPTFEQKSSRPKTLFSFQPGGLDLISSTAVKIFPHWLRNVKSIEKGENYCLLWLNPNTCPSVQSFPHRIGVKIVFFVAKATYWTTLFKREKTKNYLMGTAVDKNFVSVFTPTSSKH